MKFSKITKLLIDSVVEEMDQMTPDELRKTIAQANQSIETAIKERDENTNYINAKEVASTFNSALSLTKNYQSAKIALGLLLLKEESGDELGELVEKLEGLRAAISSRKPGKKNQDSEPQLDSAELQESTA